MNDFTETAPSLSLEWPITAQDSAHLVYSRGYTYNTGFNYTTKLGFIAV